jgi:hypothetical protein
MSPQPVSSEKDAIQRDKSAGWRVCRGGVSHFEAVGDKRISQHLSGSVPLGASSSNNYWQLRVLRFGFLQDGYVGVAQHNPDR